MDKEKRLPHGAGFFIILPTAALVYAVVALIIFA